MQRRGQKLHHRLIKKMTTAKLGHRTNNRRHWSEVQTRGTSTGNPYSCHYTNGLLGELKIQTLYERNTRRRTIKSTRVSIRSHLRASQARKQKKCKNDVTDTSGIEHASPQVHGVRVSAVPLGSWWILAVYIRN